MASDVEKLRQIIAGLVEQIDRETCAHEETHRGGAIWTICDGCGQQWADDRGGFVPHTDSEIVTQAREALTQPAASGEVAPERCADCRHTTFEKRHDGSHICVHCKTIATPQPDADTVRNADWQPPTDVPAVVYGGCADYWVAVRRKHNGKVYSFPATYLNEMGLVDDDNEPLIEPVSGNHWIQLPPADDEFNMLATGWYDAKQNMGDDMYTPLLDSTDELVAWREVAPYVDTLAIDSAIKGEK